MPPLTRLVPQRARDIVRTQQPSPNPFRGCQLESSRGCWCLPETSTRRHAPPFSVRLDLIEKKSDRSGSSATGHASLEMGDDFHEATSPSLSRYDGLRCSTRPDRECASGIGDTIHSNGRESAERARWFVAHDWRNWDFGALFW